jgi:hypothetical protein
VSSPAEPSPSETHPEATPQLEDEEMEIEAVCHPGVDRREMQTIRITARRGNHALCTLDALRLADVGFTPGDMHLVVAAFDEHSAYSFGLAKDMMACATVLRKRYQEDVLPACGFIAITTIRTHAEARGNRHAPRLLRYLQDMHAGMTWYACLQAAPLDLAHGGEKYVAMRRRLVNYYASDRGLGFDEVAPRAAPGLMLARWEYE